MFMCSYIVLKVGGVVLENVAIPMVDRVEVTQYIS